MTARLIVRWFAHRVAVTLLVCGALETTALAARPPMPRPETEPNDTIETANPLPLRGGYGIGTGALEPGDQDIWSFIAPQFGKVWILVDTGGTQMTGATSRDTVIQLLDVDGVSVLDADDNDGTGTGGEASH